jgi:hypothetical protein
MVGPLSKSTPLGWFDGLAMRRKPAHKSLVRSLFPPGRPRLTQILQLQVEAILASSKGSL